MVASRHLLVINQYYAPDLASTGQYAAQLCAGLAQRGVEVTVITAQPSYLAESPEAPSFEVREGVRIYRVPMGSAKGRERMSTRLYGYGRFLLGAWRMANRLMWEERPDVILTFHNPPLVGLLGAWLSSRYGIPFVYAPLDIHPDILLAMGWRLPSPLVWAWKRVDRFILSRATRVIVLGDGMRRTLEAKGTNPLKLMVIPLWGLPEFPMLQRDDSIREELGLAKEELLVLYAGNMGLLHPLDPIIDAAAMLQDKRVRFLFVGDGIRRAHLVRRVQEEALSNVHFLPYQSAERFQQLVAAADLCLVVLQPGLERLALPSRAFTFLSAGKPLITLMSEESEIARLVREERCGWNVRDGAELRAVLEQLIDSRDDLHRASINARRVYEHKFQRDVIISAYAEALGL